MVEWAAPFCRRSIQALSGGVFPESAWSGDDKPSLIACWAGRESGAPKTNTNATIRSSIVDEEVILMGPKLQAMCCFKNGRKDAVNNKTDHRRDHHNYDWRDQ